jgi:hypothetical protein
VDEQIDGLKRQQLIRRAIVLAIGSMAAGAAVAVPSESDAISPIHLGIGTGTGGGDLRTLDGKKEKAAASLQNLPPPSYVSGAMSLIKYILVETNPPTNNQYKIPDKFKPLAYFRFDLAGAGDYFAVADHSTAEESFEIPYGDAPSLYIVLCGLA